MTSHQVLTPQHPAWNRFAETLYEILENCGGCFGDLRTCNTLLDDSPFHKEATLAYFEKNGGYCDCEVLINVDKLQEKPAPEKVT